MKAIMISIRPQWVAKILNGEKTIEIRKKFPSDYVGWVYIYCTKNGGGIFRHQSNKKYSYLPKKYSYINNGKVVARFWCDKVEKLYEYQVDGYGSDYEIASDSLKQEELLKQCCLTNDQLHDYCEDINNLKAIHITKLEIFDKPKEISNFMKVSCKGCPFENTQTCHNDTSGKYCKITRAPQSWCYIEV